MPVDLIVVLDVQIHCGVPQVAAYFGLQVEIVWQPHQHVGQRRCTVSSVLLGVRVLTGEVEDGVGEVVLDAVYRFFAVIAADRNGMLAAHVAKKVSVLPCLTVLNEGAVTVVVGTARYVHVELAGYTGSFGSGMLPNVFQPSETVVPR